MTVLLVRVSVPLFQIPPLYPAVLDETVVPLRVAVPLLARPPPLFFDLPPVSVTWVTVACARLAMLSTWLFPFDVTTVRLLVGRWSSVRRR
jgi:hypothetical protein